MTTTTTTALGAALGLGLALVAVPAATADPGSCQGRAVTVSGATGTDGDDVMVVGPGHRSAGAGAGNDLVCVRLGDDLGASFFLDAGAGDDVVHNETTASIRWVSVTLGTGADTYVGSDASRETVRTGADLSGGTTDTEKDVVDTRGGDDSVSTGSVTPGTPNADLISTGSGDDGVRWAGEQVGDPLDLGAGENQLTLLSGWNGSDIDIDAPGARVSVDSRPVLRWTGAVSAYTLTYTHLRTTFTGSDLDEYLTFWPSQRDAAGPASSVGDPALRVNADMGAGDDRFALLDTAGGSWAGGDGQDRLGMPRCQVADVRLGRDYECQDESQARTAYSGVMSSWEKLSVSGGRLRVIGSAGPDNIRVRGRRVRLDGRGGDDVLSAPGSAGSRPSVPPAVVRGGAGADLVFGGYLRDRLLGGPGNDRIYGNGYPDVIKGGPGRDRLWGGKRADRLLGGGGRDRADGGPARDRCSAEVRLACERR